MYTDALTITGINAAPPTPMTMPAPGSAAVTPPALIQVAVRSETTGLTFAFNDLASNAAQYVFGATLALTIGSAPAVKAAS